MSEARQIPDSPGSDVGGGWGVGSYGDVTYDELAETGGEEPIPEAKPRHFVAQVAFLGVKLKFNREHEARTLLELSGAASRLRLL